jgi:CubicO group peptidase (beta-lactamase class C family)
MKRSISASLCALGTVVALTATSAWAQQRSPLPTATPESVGLSPAGLARMMAAFKSEIDNDRLPGAVIAIARKGKLAYFDTAGFRDKAAKAPMTKDAIFSIASMTKPMVSVAVMMLWEEGKIRLNDPVSVYLPALANRTVAVAKVGADGKTTYDNVPAKRQPTVQDLLRHTSGIPYGARGDTPIHKMWPGSSAGAAQDYTGKEFIDKIATLPLVSEPNTRWEYSLSVDVLGQIVEKVSGKTLGAFLSERIWKPLGMVDTSFEVPEAKKGRYARALENDPMTGKPQTVLHAPGNKPLKYECGGGCAVSTASDYIRFAQMLLNGGTFEGKRLLGRKTVEFMTADHLGPEVENNVSQTEPARKGYGFGLGFAVRRQTGIAAVAGSAGDYNWAGAYGTFFWVDPKEQLVAVYMSQAPGAIRQQHRALFTDMVLQTLD